MGLKTCALLIGHHPLTPGAGGSNLHLDCEVHWSSALAAACVALEPERIAVVKMRHSDNRWPHNFEAVRPQLDAHDLVVSLHANGGAGAPDRLHLALVPEDDERAHEAQLAGAVLTKALSRLTGWRCKSRRQDRSWSKAEMVDGIYTPAGPRFALWDCTTPALILETHKIDDTGDHSVMLDLLLDGSLPRALTAAILEVLDGQE